MMCPDGLNLHPNKRCECVDQRVIDKLYEEWENSQSNPADQFPMCMTSEERCRDGQWWN
jgi:hypothetical protein